jgi:hypothetical protein
LKNNRGFCGEGGIRTRGTELPVRQFSKLLISATHPPHQGFLFINEWQPLPESIRDKLSTSPAENLRVAKIKIRGHTTQKKK